MDSKCGQGITITDPSLRSHQREPTKAVTFGARSTLASAPPITEPSNRPLAMRRNVKSYPGDACQGLVHSEFGDFMHDVAPSDDLKVNPPGSYRKATPR